MNVSPDDDIVRNPLLDVFVEIVDSSDQMLCRKESPRAALEAVSSWQTLEDGERILAASIRGRHEDRGRVTVEEHWGRCEAVAGGGQVACVARGEGVVRREVGSNWNIINLWLAMSIELNWVYHLFARGYGQEGEGVFQWLALSFASPDLDLDINQTPTPQTTYNLPSLVFSIAACAFNHKFIFHEWIRPKSVYVCCLLLGEDMWPLPGVGVNRFLVSLSMHPGPEKDIYSKYFIDLSFYISVFLA